MENVLFSIKWYAARNKQCRNAIGVYIQKHDWASLAVQLLSDMKQLPVLYGDPGHYEIMMTTLTTIRDKYFHYLPEDGDYALSALAIRMQVEKMQKRDRVAKGVAEKARKEAEAASLRTRLGTMTPEALARAAEALKSEDREKAEKKRKGAERTRRENKSEHRKRRTSRTTPTKGVGYSIIPESFYLVRPSVMASGFAPIGSVFFIMTTGLVVLYRKIISMGGFWRSSFVW